MNAPLKLDVRETAIPTQSPLQIELRFDLEVAPAVAFDLVANRLPEWFSTIHSVQWDHSKSTTGPSTAGACSERTCNFGGKVLREVIISFKPGRGYTYRADLGRSSMKMPLEGHFGSFELEAIGTGTRVTWRQYFKPKWFVPGAMLRWQMRDKMMRPAIEKLLALSGRLAEKMPAWPERSPLERARRSLLATLG